MEPAGRPDFLAGSVEQGVIDGYRHGAGRYQEGDDEVGQGQAELFGGPDGVGEEPVGPVMGPHPGQAGAREHAADRSFPCLRQQAAHQCAERDETRCGETRP